MVSADRLKANIQASIAAKQAMLANEGLLSAFASAVSKTIDCYRKGGRLYIAGNGGSAADAQHLACEFVVRMARDRAPMPAEALTVDGSILTATSNDYGFEHVFARQLAGKAREHDLFLAISTSGHSPNIIKALEQCRAMGLPSILLTGRDGGPAGPLADYVLNVEGNRTSTIQEQHVVVYHALCECVEATICDE
jgi:D-sedoheptulose 7-phosphate isomerase